MANAFFYMFIVGAGASSGVAVVGLVTYLLVKKLFMEKQQPKKNRKRGVI